jgi:hypothetical protein
MRKIFTLIPVVLGLGGGVASASPYHRVERREIRNERVERREIRNERVERAEHFRDYRVRPAVRFERFENRSGFRWVAGAWSWDGYEWIWASGHYVRC